MDTHFTHFNPEDGVSMFLPHVDIRLQDCDVTAQKTTIWIRSSGKKKSPTFLWYDMDRI
jgi:hypothetical protein